MEAERHESQSDDAQQYPSEGLTQEELERASEALDLARVVVEAGLHEKPTDDQKNDAAGEHAESAELDHDVSFGGAHLRALQVLGEGGSVGLEELAESDHDRDEADDGRHPAAGRVGEDGSYRFLSAVAGSSA